MLYVLVSHHGYSGVFLTEKDANNAIRYYKHTNFITLKFESPEKLNEPYVYVVSSKMSFPYFVSNNREEAINKLNDLIRVGLAYEDGIDYCKANFGMLERVKIILENKELAETKYKDVDLEMELMTIDDIIEMPVIDDIITNRDLLRNGNGRVENDDDDGETMEVDNNLDDSEINEENADCSSEAVVVVDNNLNDSDIIKADADCVCETAAIETVATEATNDLEDNETLDQHL